jgi:hypothetical protein
MRRLLYAGLVVAAALLGFAAARTFLAPPQQVVVVLPHGPTASPPPAPVTPAAPGADEVHITVSGDDVPGCFAADEPFRAVVRSRWGELRSENVLVFRWRLPVASEAAIEVHIEGQPKAYLVKPGQKLPDVTLALPLGDRLSQVRLSTFLYERRNEAGEACFRWVQPPGTPRPQPVPTAEEQA